MTTEERAFLRTVQEDLPLAPRPFAQAAARLGTPEGEVVGRIEAFRVRLWIRRFAALLHHREAGYSHNVMVAFDVPPERIDAAGERAAAFPFVTHCYRRTRHAAWPYNLYAMVHARTDDESKRRVAEVCTAVGEVPWRALMSLHEYKKTSLRIAREAGSERMGNEPPAPVHSAQRALAPFLTGRDAFTPGTVYLAGAGPGDPGLVTARTLSLLLAADVIVHDHLIPAECLALARPGAETVYVGKEAGCHTMPQEEISDLLVARASRGLIVLRLKGGDPFVFGRGGEEALRCREAGIPFAVVPGVTAAIAAGACAGIPVTHRRTALSFCLVTGHEALKEESQLNFTTLAGVDTLAIYMGVGQMDELARRLIAHGKPATTPAAVVMRGTLANQRTVTGTLGTIAERSRAEGITPPAILFVGATVALREQLAWFETRPLSGRSVLVTRSREQAGRLSAKLTALGAQARELPLIRIVPPQDPAPLDDALARIDTFRVVIFTSVNGVRHTLDRLLARGRDMRALGHAAVVSIGTATTAALAEYRLFPDHEAKEFVAEDLFRLLKDQFDLKECEILLPRSNLARPYLREALTGEGARVTECTAYDTVPAELSPGDLAALGADPPDWITFTSSSTVHHLFRLVPGIAELIRKHAIRLASIGPITTAALSDHGFSPDVQAGVYTIDGLLQALLEKEST